MTLVMRCFFVVGLFFAGCRMAERHANESIRIRSRLVFSAATPADGVNVSVCTRYGDSRINSRRATSDPGGFIDISVPRAEADRAWLVLEKTGFMWQLVSLPAVRDRETTTLYSKEDLMISDGRPPQAESLQRFIQGIPRSFYSWRKRQRVIATAFSFQSEVREKLRDYWKTNHSEPWPLVLMASFGQPADIDFLLKQIPSKKPDEWNSPERLLAGIVPVGKRTNHNDFLLQCKRGNHGNAAKRLARYVSNIAQRSKLADHVSRRMQQSSRTTSEDLALYLSAAVSGACANGVGRPVSRSAPYFGVVCSFQSRNVCVFEGHNDEVELLLTFERADGMWTETSHLEIGVIVE